MRQLPPVALCAWLLLIALSAHAHAQSGPAKPAAPPAPGAPPAVSVPGAQSILLITRSILMTLSDALRSGNFTVLRDLAAPGFQSANTAAKLSAVFRDLLERHIDLTPVAVNTPQIEAAEIVPGRKMLHLKGRFPLPPSAVAFDLLFDGTSGSWRLFGISVQPVLAVSAPPEPAAAKAARNKK